MAKIIVDSNVLINSFQRGSIHRNDSIAFIDQIVRYDQLISMPAHGWFEVWCNLKRISSVDRTYLPPFFAGKMQLPLELIHIDDQFIKKYGNINIPYSKGADHIFIVVAYENQYPLITWDDKMRKIAKKVGVQVYDPKEYLQGF